MAIRSVFEGGRLAPKSALKQPNMYLESVIFENVSRLPRKKVDEFVNSKEAKTMMQEGYLSQATLERLANEHGMPGCVKSIACHLARENNDPAFKELLDSQRKAHQAIEEIIDKYGRDAEPIAQQYQQNLDSILPDYFKP